MKVTIDASEVLHLVGTEAATRRFIKDAIDEKIKRTALSPIQKVHDLITQWTADYFGLSKNQIFIKSRSREILDARYAAIYIFHSVFRFSKKSIGKYFGFDHSTVINAIKCVENDPGLMLSTNHLAYRIKLAIS